MSLFLPSITISVKQRAYFIRKHEFCTRKMGKEYYLYQKPQNEWIKSAALFLFNPIKNIFWDCIVLLIGSFAFFLCKNINKELNDQIKFKMKAHTYLRVFLILIPQILINLVGVLSFGLFSHRCNIISGDLERWSTGTTKEDLLKRSRNSRNYLSGYLAPCEQPIAILKENIEGGSFFQLIREENQRALFSILLENHDFAKSVSKDRWEKDHKPFLS
jgi:hypothetical protein